MMNVFNVHCHSRVCEDLKKNVFRFRDCVKIEFVTSTKGRSLKIFTDFSVESAAADFEMTFIELLHSYFHVNNN